MNGHEKLNCLIFMNLWNVKWRVLNKFAGIQHMLVANFRMIDLHVNQLSRFLFLIWFLVGLIDEWMYLSMVSAIHLIYWSHICLAEFRNFIGAASYWCSSLALILIIQRRAVTFSYEEKILHFFFWGVLQVWIGKIVVVWLILLHFISTIWLLDKIIKELVFPFGTIFWCCMTI